MLSDEVTIHISSLMRIGHSIDKIVMYRQTKEQHLSSYNENNSKNSVLSDEAKTYFFTL